VDSDADIRVVLRQGDPSALSLIHQRYGGVLHAMLLGYLGRPQEADDALQDLFVTVSQQRERLAGAQNLGAYLMTMARNLALMALRQRKRRREQEHPAEMLSPATQQMDVESASAVSHAVMQLPGEQREVLVLKIWQDRTFAEIAVLLDISINTAASRYRYATEKLRGQLKAWR
jgi:RNA polymerase sigma-70 factor (ECF subfamily)